MPSTWLYSSCSPKSNPLNMVLQSCWAFECTYHVFKNYVVPSGSKSWQLLISNFTNILGRPYKHCLACIAGTWAIWGARCWRMQEVCGKWDSTCTETPLNLFAAPKKVSGQTLSPSSLTRALCPSHFPQHCVPFITQAAALQANTVSFTVTVKAMHS